MIRYLNIKGQALVEFALILPVVLIIIFMCFDFSRIFYEKTKLENNSTDIINYYKNNPNYDDTKKYMASIDKSVKLEINIESNKSVFMLTKNISILTPGLNLILDNPYKIEVKRVYENE